MTDSTSKAAFGLQRFHGYFAIAAALVLLIAGIFRSPADLSFGVLMIGLSPALAALGVLGLDGALANERAERTRGITPDDDGRRWIVTAAGVLGAVLTGVGAAVEFAVAATRADMVSAWIMVVAAVVVVAMAFFLPAFVRTRVAPEIDPADAQRSEFARRRQFGRPRAAIAFGVVIGLVGAVALALAFADHGATDLRLWIFGPLLIVAAIAIVFFAVRQIRTK